MTKPTADKPVSTSTKHAQASDATPDYMALVAHYEACLKTHGPNHLGVDWPNEQDLKTRFDVMLGLIPPVALQCGDAVSLLDLGCGPGLLLSHVAGRSDLSSLSYHGIDISDAMIAAARAVHDSAKFCVRDILLDPLPDESVDFVILNGVLTEKCDLTFDAMEAFAVRIIQAAFRASRKGIAFNVMSAHVDWERDALFHWPVDRMMSALTPMSRHIRLRADYGLYEYTSFIYRDAQHG